MDDKEKVDIKLKSIEVIGFFNDGSAHQMIIDDVLRDLLLNVSLRYYDDKLKFMDNTLGLEIDREKDK